MDPSNSNSIFINQLAIEPQDAATVVLSLKQKEFNIAIDLYKSNPIYSVFGNFVSVTNISLQVYLLWVVLRFPIGIVWQMVALVVSFFLADFINGLVHLFMDQNDDYVSIVGPLVANFHLHHKIPKYKNNILPIVYFNESGSKIWLVGYLLSISIFSSSINHVVLHILVYIGILSSVAEVSHYLCHSSNSTLTNFLSKIGILLPKSHHAKHHVNDNMNYAFLNGLADPLINVIAKTFYKSGYKHTTDLHYIYYSNGHPDQR